MSKKIFEGEIDFCSECGAILPLPGVEDKVVCPLCSFAIDVRTFDGLTSTTKVVFNDKEQLLKKKKKGENTSSGGPLVDRKCPRCGHEGMTYATLQTRSADEGQTVFYSCPQCQHQEHENS